MHHQSRRGYSRRSGAQSKHTAVASHIANQPIRQRGEGLKKSHIFAGYECFPISSVEPLRCVAAPFCQSRQFPSAPHEIQGYGTEDKRLKLMLMRCSGLGIHTRTMHFSAIPVQPILLWQALILTPLSTGGLERPPTQKQCCWGRAKVPPSGS